MTKEREKKPSFLDGFVHNCAAELKILLTALFILCTIATLLQFLPSRFTISTSDLRVCISRLTTTTTITAEPPLSAATPAQETTLQNGIVKRTFNPYGSAAYNFVTMGAYRGGLNTFAIIGISSKPLHVFGKPSYACKWVPLDSTKNATFASNTYKILPDWGYGRVYTVVVVNCTFDNPVNEDNKGGKLVLYASASSGGDTLFVNSTDEIECLTEEPMSQNFSVFVDEPKYDYLYCGSSLYGDLSPQRVREWIAYHVRFFGEKSHFVIHDAGGVHEDVLEVLKPWMELGYVTLQDIRDQERFDGYYHNQFMVVNDCLHRYKFMAKWMFFFDVDEFIYVTPKNTIKSVLDSMSGYTQFTMEQMPMNNKLCLTEDRGKSNRKWGMEKLVYKDVKRGVRRDRKYAVQPRNLFSAGVHLSQNFVGKTTHNTEGRIKYFHYHGTIAERREPCRIFINSTQMYLDKVPYSKDTTMREITGAVKRFELKMIGTRLQNTTQ